ncbi:MAG: ATP-grasp domain-containing protein [Ignavibacteria bacterium]
MKKNVLVFGAGELQGSLIESVKRLNYKVIAIDPDSNAPCRQLADVFETVGANDFDKTLSIARKYRISGIVTSSTDKPLRMMSKIAESLNLIFPSVNAVRLATDKCLMKKAFIKHGIPCARGFLVNKNLYINNYSSGINFPVVVKPVDSSGSRGVVVCNNIVEVEQAIEQAMKFTKKKKVLIEEYIEGKEISVESLTYGGKTYIIQITDKLTSLPPYNVELGHTEPSGLSEHLQSIVKELVIEVIQALSLDNCACHTEIKINRDTPYVIEIGARLGGDFITSHLVPFSTGVNMEQILTLIACGEHPYIEKKSLGGSAIRYLSLLPGRVKTVPNLDFLKENTFVKWYKLSVREGDVIEPVTDSLSRHGYVITTGKNAREAASIAENMIKQITRSIKITTKL